MSLLGNIKKFLGLGDDDEKKKKQQQQAQSNSSAQKPGALILPIRPGQNPSQSPQQSQRPNNGVNLVLPNQTGGTMDGLPAPLKKPQPAATSEPPKTSPAPGETLLRKAGNVGKALVKGAVAGERELAKGIARVLPGGTADMDANNAMSAQAADRAAQATAALRAGKLSREEAVRRTKTVASDADNAVTAQKAIEKSMPTKASIALGGAS